VFSIISKDSAVKSKKGSKYSGDLFQPISSEVAETGEGVFLPLVAKETEETNEQCYENTTFISMFSSCICWLFHHKTFFPAKNRLKPIPVDEFSEHVQRMHADRDNFFELEYSVRM
jgi:hypothetical protein